MKIIHISDLHFGKNLGLQELDEDQRYWSRKFIEFVNEESPDAVVIAGDVYDRGAPDERAVALLDEFFTDLLNVNDRLHVLVIAGNHDSGQKLAFGSKIFRKQRLHIVGRLAHEQIESVELKDEYGPIRFWLLPYTYPDEIRSVLSDETLKDYTSAMRALMSRQEVDRSVRNVLVSHQNVLCHGNSPNREGSESCIGGVGGIDGTVFEAFDYVALGHIHKAQSVGRDTMRYAGSPLCYHFGEERRSPVKGPLIVTMNAKGAVSIDCHEITPLHPLVAIRATLEEILNCSEERKFIKVTVTDRRKSRDVCDAIKEHFQRMESTVIDIEDANTEKHGRENGDDMGLEKTPELSLSEWLVKFWYSRLKEEPRKELKELMDKVTGLVEEDNGDIESNAEKIVNFVMEGAE